MEIPQQQEPESTIVLPTKPEIRPARTNVLKTILSLAIYIGAYYIFFHISLKWILLVVLVIFLHEMGHFISMKFFGYSDVKMFFVPFLGAYVSGEPQRVSQYQRAITILAGPIPGIIIGLIFFWLYNQTESETYRLLAFIFIALNALNLLPVSPLDGGQLLENIFFHSNRLVQSIFIILSCVALFYVAVITRNYFLLLIIWLLMIRFRFLNKIDGVRRELDRQGIAYDKSYSEISDDEYRQIRRVMITKIRSLSDNDPDVESDEEEDIASYMKNVLTTPSQKDLSNGQKAIIFLIWIFFLILPIIVYLNYSLKNISI